MGRYDESDWPPYVPVAERRRRAAQKIAKMNKAGQDVSPVEIVGRKIAETFWGDAWCKNLEAYSDYSNRLPRGRTYVRNGSVLDLQIEAGRVRALVNGTELYTVDIKIKPLPEKRWEKNTRRCAGQIDSLVELFQGSISTSVMEIVTRKGEGLFPSPHEITLSCSCPDWATMCKHVAATLYGIGARLDHEPELLFALRGVDPAEMVQAAIDQPTAAGKTRKGRVLETDELSSVFGVDIDMDGVSSGEATTPITPVKRTQRAAKPPKPASSRETSRKTAAIPATRRSAAAKKTAGKKKSTTAEATLKKAAAKKVAKLSGEELQRLHVRATKFVGESLILREIVEAVQLARGRLYLRRDREDEDLMARITPLGPRSMLLETPHRNSWTEHKRGQLTTVLKYVESDTRGDFHGLGSLVARKRGAKPSAQQILQRDFNVPIRVLAEPEYWYSMHRKPAIAEVNDTKDRVLVRFAAYGMSGSFHGTCLYALKDGEWGCYTIKPSASETIATAETWLNKRDWEDWG